MSDREAEYFEVHTLEGDAWKVLSTSSIDRDPRGLVLVDESGETFDAYVLVGDHWDDYNASGEDSIRFTLLIQYSDPIPLIDANGHIVILNSSRISRIEGPYYGTIGSFADVMREVFSKDGSKDETAASEDNDAGDAEGSSDAGVKDVFV